MKIISFAHAFKARTSYVVNDMNLILTSRIINEYEFIVKSARLKIVKISKKNVKYC